MVTYTVNIVNNKGGEDQERYVAFFGDVSGAVSSQNNAKLQSVVVFLTKPLSKGRSAQFQFTSQIYGFVGESTVQSSSLKAGHKVTLTASEPVTLGHPQLNNGTDLTVSPSADGEDMNLAASAGQSPGGSFTIYTNAGIPASNFYVTGVAREIDTGTSQVRPVAVLPVQAGQKSIIKPALNLYIGRIDNDSGAVSLGSVVDPDKFIVKQKVVFATGQKEITVSYSTDANSQSIFTVV